MKNSLMMLSLGLLVATASACAASGEIQIDDSDFEPVLEVAVTQPAEIESETPIYNKEPMQFDVPQQEAPAPIIVPATVSVDALIDTLAQQVVDEVAQKLKATIKTRLQETVKRELDKVK